jgi:hypothetical protein
MKITAGLVSAFACNVPNASGDDSEPSAGVALHARVATELRGFVSWLREHDERGYIGEVGWPGNPGDDVEKWNALADAWFEVADEAGLWVTAWATGEWWASDYRLAIYRDREAGPGVDSPNSQAGVLESHTEIADLGRGINVAGGEFGAPVAEDASTFSHRDPGTHGRDYQFDPSETFEYLASRGHGLARIPFRWERLQPRLGDELDRQELGRLEAVVARASSAGLRVVLDMHNYGAYYLEQDGRGARCAIGSERCPIERFVDAWRGISAAFKDDDGVIAYGLMNEPVGLDSTTGSSETEVWHEASQRALNAIRQEDDEKMVMVSGYFWAGVREWSKWNPEPWIEDPADRTLYEAHHYFDGDGSGRYERSYSEEVGRAGEKA